jgi:Holliday junction resolvase RusA-like endonuclease
MPEVRLELPLPPSANHRYVRRRDGGLALTREARDYDAFVLEALGRERPRIPAHAAVEVHVSLRVDTPRRRDLDNVLKQLLDSLGRCLGFDDAQVVAIKAFKHVRRGADAKVKVIVTWKEISRARNDRMERPKCVQVEEPRCDQTR